MKQIDLYLYCSERNDRRVFDVLLLITVLENVFISITHNWSKGILLSIACICSFLHLHFVCVYLVFKK